MALYTITREGGLYLAQRPEGPAVRCATRDQAVALIRRWRAS